MGPKASRTVGLLGAVRRAMEDEKARGLSSAASPLIPPPKSEIDLEAGAGDQLQCRICLETDGRDFIAPCKCKGTSKYMHRDCLDHWRAVKEAVMPMIKMWCIEMKKWYVVYEGRVPGVYDEWEDCLKQVNKFKGNSYKGYKSKEEAEAMYMNHLLAEEKRNRMKASFIVIPVLLTMIAVLLYLIVV